MVGHKMEQLNEISVALLCLTGVVLWAVLLAIYQRRRRRELADAMLLLRLLSDEALLKHDPRGHIEQQAYWAEIARRSQMRLEEMLNSNQRLMAQLVVARNASSGSRSASSHLSVDGQ
jgi:hypothetical protein